jgi:hypothetical protein
MRHRGSVVTVFTLSDYVRVVRNTDLTDSSLSTVAVVGKGVEPTAAINETGSSNPAVDGFVVVARRKRREVWIATLPVKGRVKNRGTSYD